MSGRAGPQRPSERGGHLVLLSGGLDSTVCLAVTASHTHPCEPLVTLTFDYGQRHRVELDHAAQVSDHFGADHLVVGLDATAWGGSALTDAGMDVPDAYQDDGIPPTYVPARNLIFLSVAMGVAEARDLLDVTIGVNALDFSGYPDCRPEFIASFRATAALALKRGLEGRPVDVLTPLMELAKGDIVSLGLSVDAPLDLTWSCYRGGARPCRSCDSCALRARGFAAAGVRDPALAGT